MLENVTNVQQFQFLAFYPVWLKSIVFSSVQLLREYFIPLKKQLDKNRNSVDYINEKVAYWTQRRVPRLMTSPDVLNRSTEIFAFNARNVAEILVAQRVWTCAERGE